MHEVNLNFKKSLVCGIEIQYFKISFFYMQAIIHFERCKS